MVDLSVIAGDAPRTLERVQTGKAGAVLLLCLIGGLWFFNLDHRVLAEPDEGRYAEIPREMLASGDWITPRLNDLKYFEKPPLQYWATALGYRLFGLTEGSARLYPAALGFLAILLVYGLGRRLWGRDAGLYSAMLLAGALMWGVIGHLNILDMGLSFWLSAALGCFLLAQATSAAARAQRNWMMGCWAALALAVLSKGPVALAVPALTLAAYSLMERDIGLWRRLHLGAGALILLLLAAPWFVLVSLRNSDFTAFFFIHEHLDRYLTTAHERTGSWWYYFPVLLTGSLPWTGAMFRGSVQAWRTERERTGFRTGRFLVVYVLCVLVFFSFSNSKLAPYMTPVFPALALLGGRALTGCDGEALRRTLLPWIAVAALGSMIAWLLLFISPSAGLARYAPCAPWLLGAAIVLAMGGVLAALTSFSKYARHTVTVLAVAALAWGQLLMGAHNALSRERSGYFIAQAMEQRLTPSTRLYAVGQYVQTVPFYLRRTMTVAAYRGELAFGMDAEPGKALPTLYSFILDWRRPGPAMATVKPSLFPHLTAAGLPMNILLDEPRAIVIVKP